MKNSYITNNKIFYHLDRLQDYIDGKTVRPITVRFRLTDNCNLKCDYCFFKNNLMNYEMKREDVFPIFDKLKEMGVRGVVFTGGEPTCYSNLKESLDYAKKICGFDLGLITNGVIYPQGLDNLTWIRFSLDTIYPITYKLMKSKDLFNKVLLNIDRVIDEKKKKNLDVTIGVQMVVTWQNYSEIEKFVDYWNDKNIDYCQIRPLENYTYDENMMSYIKKYLENIDNKKYKIGVVNTAYKWEELEEGFEKNYKGCPNADLIGAVDAKGDFYLCCSMIKDKTAKYGNLLKDSIDEIFSRRKKVQRKFDYSKCTLACQSILLNKIFDLLKSTKHINFI